MTMRTKEKNGLHKLIEVRDEDRIQVCRVKDKINFQNLDVVEWFDVISNGTKKRKSDEFDRNIYTTEKRRALKKLSKIVTEARIEQGYILGSMFSYISVVREEITTEMIDGKKMDDFTRDPYDFDYTISVKGLPYVDEPTKVIYSAVTCDVDQPLVCSHCKGEGFFRCKDCKGSGREQYVDGYYANGEERIKTGQCTTCYGTGKIQCKKCAGRGELKFLSNQYQIIKKFQNARKVAIHDVIYTTFDKHEHDFQHYECDFRHWVEYGDDDDDVPSRWREILTRWGGVDEADIDTLYKNQKEIIIDKSQILPNGVSEECRRAYENIKKRSLYFSEIPGKLGCIIGKHFAMPMCRLYFSTKLDDREYQVDIYENHNEKMICCFDGLPELSFFKSLFL